VGRSGKVVFARNNSHFRVKCDLDFNNQGQALALYHIIEAFKVSVARADLPLVSVNKPRGVIHGSVG